MKTNNFELIGKVNFIDVKMLDSGTYLTKILLGIYLGKAKDGTSNYDSVNITFWGDTAEQFAGTAKKGDQVHISGRISTNTYKNKEGKDVKNIEFIGNEFFLVEYDKQLKEYLPL